MSTSPPITQRRLLCVLLCAAERGSGGLTCGLGLVHPGGGAGTAEAHGVQRQHPEGVVGVGRQLEAGGGPGARHLRQVVPVSAVVQGVLVLDQEL